MTRHLEDSERAMQERVQRLEALRLSLEEVRPFGLGLSSSPVMSEGWQPLVFPASGPWGKGPFLVSASSGPTLWTHPLLCLRGQRHRLAFMPFWPWKFYPASKDSYLALRRLLGGPEGTLGHGQNGLADGCLRCRS
jgi:hypothetical protein